MSNTAELCARLLEHAAIHDRETSPYSPEQAAWAADLRDAAALIQAAPVVERADSATAVVERGAGNLSDNAAPVAHARWYCVTNYGGATLCTSRADAAEVAAEQDIAIPRHGPHRAVMMAEVLPARVPLTDERLNAAGLDYALADSFSGKAEWVAQDIADAFLRHRVLVVRDQRIDRALRFRLI